MCQTACKPGSVRAAPTASVSGNPPRRSGTTIPLGRALRRASRDQPGRRGGNASAATGRSGASSHAAGRPYSVLLPVGFALPPPLPGARCALTAPFHPCPPTRVAPPCLRTTLCAGGLFSVALSLGSPPPAVSRHRIPVEPGLSSAHRANPAGSGRPAVWRGRHGRGSARRQAARRQAVRRQAVRRQAVPGRLRVGGSETAWPARFVAADRVGLGAPFPPAPSAMDRLQKPRPW